MNTHNIFKINQIFFLELMEKKLGSFLNDETNRIFNSNHTRVNFNILPKELYLRKTIIIQFYRKKNLLYKTS